MGDLPIFKRSADKIRKYVVAKLISGHILPAKMHHTQQQDQETQTCPHACIQIWIRSIPSHLCPSKWKIRGDTEREHACYRENNSQSDGKRLIFIDHCEP
ncbi:hypothetical protein D3C74_411590 [compost metagenome]